MIANLHVDAMLSELKTQFNVLKALTVHDLQGQMKAYNYGFAWVILEPLFFIAGFRLMRQFLGSMATPSGMTPLLFYVLGVLPLYLCFEGIKGYQVAASSDPLLSMPRVTPVDITLASGLSAFAVYFVLFWLIAVPVSIYENVWPPRNILGVMTALIFAWMIGVATGFILSGAYRAFPPAKQFIGYTNFALRMASGMFFCITMIPIEWWPYLSWNPLLHCTELIRADWFESYVSPIASPIYVGECILAMLLLGLSIERFMRRIPYA